MAGKFAPSAREVIVDAVDRARREGSRGVIREEHLLAAVMAHPTTRPIIGRAGRPEVAWPGEAEAILSEIKQGRRRGGLSAAETGALGTLGIDLEHVVGRVEAALGEGALEPTGRAAGRWRTSMSAEASLVLAAARRQATATGARELTAAHLLLGLVAGPVLLADSFARRGITSSTVLAALEEPVSEAGEER